MDTIENPDVADRFLAYPDDVRQKLLGLRRLIMSVATECSDVADLEETLKWGEPSYLARGGSTVRLGWKKSSPEDYAIFFNCNSRLVDTFRQIYADEFRFEGNRAIVFRTSDNVPTN